MREKTRSFRRDNRGLTLVELLCTIAIFVCITTAIGSVLVVTAKTYQKGTTEAALQQEAQNAVNMIEGIIVDAQDAVNYYCTDAAGNEHMVFNETEAVAQGASSDTNRRLEIKNGGAVQYNIAYIAAEDKLYYQNLVDSTEMHLLAEDVKTFQVDVSDFAKSNNVVLGIEMEKGESKFRSDYNVTARNDEVVPNSYALSKWAVINVTPAEVILEPNETQTFNIDVQVYSGGDDDFEYIMSNNSSSDTTINRVGNTLTLTVGNNETGGASNIIWINVKSKELDDSGIALASEYIKVKIRRVDGISLALTQVSGATAYESGAVYTVTPTLSATSYLAREAGEPLADYKNPRFVQWDYDFTINGTSTAMNTYFNIEEYEDVDAPYAKITLLQEMPAGGKLTITGSAKHPNGANKAAVAYNTTVVDSATLLRTGTELPGNPLGSNFKRGTEYMFQGDEYLSVACDYSCVPEGVQTMKRYFWRYREVNDDGSKGAWSRYRRTIENSDVTHKINQVETLLLRPDKAYELEFIVALVGQSNNTLYYPFDDDLMASGTGFDTFIKGWSSVAETPESEYAKRYTIGATQLKFEEVQDSNIYVYGIGSQASPIHMYSGTTYTYDMEADYMHYGNTQSQYKLVIEEFDGTNWVPSSKSYTDFNIQIDSQFIKFTNIPTTETGTYRFCYRAEGYVMKELTNTDVLNPTYGNVAAQNFNLYNVTSDPTDVEDGVIYVKFN